MTTGASNDGAEACGVTVRGSAVLSWLPRRSGRSRRVPVGVLGGAALLSLSALSGLPFSPAGSTGAAVAATSDSAASQPMQWVSEAYAAPVTMPEIHPAPTQLTGCHVTSLDHSHAFSVCGSGTGQQRMTSKCTDGWGGHTWTAQPGNWVGRGQRSEISCDSGDHVNGQIEFRNPGPQPR